MSQPERELLEIGRRELAKLREVENLDDLALGIRAAVEDPDERYGVAGALYAAIVDDRGSTSPKHGGGSAALGAVAGLTGHSDDLYRAARTSRDVRAVERSIETDDPRYVERRIKNRVVGRALGRAGVWRRLWR